GRVRLRKMMRRLRLEKATRTKRCQPCSNSSAPRRRQLLTSDGLSSGWSGAAAAFNISDARRLRFEKVPTTKRCQACNRSATCRPPLASSDGLSSGHSGAASVLKPSGVRFCGMKLEKVLTTKRCQACNRSATRRPLLANDEVSSGHCGATSVLKLSGVRLRTDSLPLARPVLRHRRRPSYAVVPGLTFL